MLYRNITLITYGGHTDQIGYEPAAVTANELATQRLVAVLQTFSVGAESVAVGP